MDDPMIRLQAAFDRLKAFPEFLPDERAHWLELRQAVENVLEGWPAPADALPNSHMADYLEEMLAEAYARRKNPVTVFMPRNAVIDVIARLRGKA